MVAIASPNGRGLTKPYNWARVVHHEIVHVFNLEQTKFLVPHWLTEGLAVSNEKLPRPPDWNKQLVERVPSGQLFNLDTIDLGFIRPRSPLEWQLAYCQANLYVEFLAATYGEDKIGPLLDAYRDGLNTTAAIEKVTGVSKAEFEKKYRAYLDDLVKGLAGKTPLKKKSFAELKKAYETNKNDDDAAAALAEAYFNDGDKVQARELAEAVLSRKASQPLACVVMAQLAEAGGDVKKAKSLLEAGLDRNAPEPKLLKLLGKIYYQADEYQKAVEVFNLGRTAEPFDPYWLQQQARGYAKLGDKPNIIKALIEIVKLDPDELGQRKKVAQMLLDDSQAAQAEIYAKEALQIDARDKEARELVLKILRTEKKDAEADKLAKLFAK
jgi:tetratricopeptide (TPR) repeat protein